MTCDQPVLPPEFFTYQQFHSDGLEIETPSFAPGVCVGAWEQTSHNMVSIHHVGWTPGGIPGFSQIVRFVFTETITISHDRNSLDGTLQQTFYDAPEGGNVVAQCTATTHATRISVPWTIRFYCEEISNLQESLFGRWWTFGNKINGQKTVIMTLQPGTGYTLATKRQAKVVIHNGK